MLGAFHPLDPQIDPAAEWQAVLLAIELQAVKDELNLLIESGELSQAAVARRRELVDLQTRLKLASGRSIQ